MSKLMEFVRGNARGFSVSLREVPLPWHREVTWDRPNKFELSAISVHLPPDKLQDFVERAKAHGVTGKVIEGYPSQPNSAFNVTPSTEANLAFMRDLQAHFKKIDEMYGSLPNKPRSD